MNSKLLRIELHCFSIGYISLAVTRSIFTYSIYREYHFCYCIFLHASHQVQLISIMLFGIIVLRNKAIGNSNELIFISQDITKI